MRTASVVEQFLDGGGLDAGTVPGAGLGPVPGPAAAAGIQHEVLAGAEPVDLDLSPRNGEDTR
jgi:hypothetical protein